MPKGGATLCIEYVDALRETIVVAVSECSKHDNFSRKVGRDNADMRMERYRNGEDPRFVYLLPRVKGMGIKENVSFFMSPYFREKDMG